MYSVPNKRSFNPGKNSSYHQIYYINISIYEFLPECAFIFSPSFAGKSYWIRSTMTLSIGLISKFKKVIKGLFLQRGTVRPNMGHFQNFGWLMTDFILLISTLNLVLFRLPVLLIFINWTYCLFKTTQCRKTYVDIEQSVSDFICIFLGRYFEGLML